MSQADVTNWAEAAEDWIAWARTKDHDAFWAYRATFEAFVGKGTGLGIEIGAGEGRICRVLQGLGYRMTAVEPVAALLGAAEAADSAEAYVLAPAHAVPEPDGKFDLVVLYNVLMDVGDVQASVAEARRLISPKGRTIVGIVHPIFDVFMAATSGDTVRPYFDAHFFDDISDANGLQMRFRGWARPLSTYVNALAEAGLVLVRMEEPRPDPMHPASQRLTERTTVPTFLWLELRPSSDPA